MVSGRSPDAVAALLWCLLLVLLTSCLAHAAEPGTLDAVLAQAMEGRRTPALAALAIRDFRAGPEAVRGVRRLGSPDAVRPGDRWHLGSDSKAMTATLIARLVERGRLSWTARLDEMLPELAPHMQLQYRDVTLVELLSHRSGLPENVRDPAVLNARYSDRRALAAQRLDYVAAALQDPPVVPARGPRSYSNTGYIVAAVLAERATGQTFEQLMQDEVFAPLGMHSVGYGQFGGPDEPSGHVDGRVADRPGDANPAMFTPAGGGRMTLEDWARFCIDQMRGEQGKGRLLKTKTYRFLHAAQGDTRAALGWGSAGSLMGRQGPVLTHTGSDGNWYALVALFPQTGDGALVVANAAESMDGDKAALAALREIVGGLSSPVR